MKLSKSKKVFLLISVSILLMSQQLNDQAVTRLLIKSNFMDQNLTLPRSIVAVIQSDISFASKIGYEEIENLVATAVEMAGGFEGLINDSDVVVLKPNLITAYDMTNNSQDLPPEVNGMTTDWRIVKSTVELVRRYNPNGKIYILEGVANGTTEENMSSMQYTEEFIPDVDDFIYLEDRSGGWREWESPLLQRVFLPEGKGLYPDSKKPNNSAEFYLNKIYYEADVIISMPVLKNHSQSNITGAIKNVGLGSSPTNIYGGIPGDNHRFVDDTIDHDPYYLHRWIHDYYLCKPVDFVIMDGLQGSSDGPVGQTGADLASVQENMKLILAGKDAIAVDAIASLTMGYDPEKISHLTYLHNDTAGCADPTYIRVQGTQINAVKKKFDNGIRGDIYGWYSDYDGPLFTINSYDTQKNILHLDISPDDETVKIEIAVNGQFHDHYAIGEYNDITFNLGDLDEGEHAVTIYAYDKFLNSTSQVINIVTDLTEVTNPRPESFQLKQNYPNPFNPSTTITYQLDKPGKVYLTLYDAIGRKVGILINKYQQSGEYNVIFDGQGKTSGTYYYRLQFDNRTITKSMLLLK